MAAGRSWGSRKKMDTRLKALNLGCGEFKKNGYVNLDSNPDLHPDLLHDLNRFPYPFPDNHFDLIEADHVLEHLLNPFRVMKEMHRILVSQGRLRIRVPHFSRGFTHPDHKSGFDLSFPYYFNPSFQGGSVGVEFELEKSRLGWFSQPYLKKTVLSKPAYFLGLGFGKIADFFANLSPWLCSRFWCFLVGGFEEIEFHFIAKKPHSS